MFFSRRIRRFAAAILLVLMAAACLPSAPAEAAGFADVSSSSWYYDAVKYATE